MVYYLFMNSIENFDWDKQVQSFIHGSGVNIAGEQVQRFVERTRFHAGVANKIIQLCRSTKFPDKSLSEPEVIVIGGSLEGEGGKQYLYNLLSSKDKAEIAVADSRTENGRRTRMFNFGFTLLTNGDMEFFPESLYRPCVWRNEYKEGKDGVFFPLSLNRTKEVEFIQEILEARPLGEPKTPFPVIFFIDSD